MKKSILLSINIFVLLFAIACSNNSTSPNSVDKPLTSNVPSENKYVREGRSLDEYLASSSKIATLASSTEKTYNLLERLYSTTWYQSEEDYDDGVLETEEEFIFFNSTSEICKREYENGVLDGRDEYSTLTLLEEVTTSTTNEKSANAIIVKNVEGRYDVDFEGYYLYDQDTLFIIDGDSQREVKTKLERLIQLANSGGNLSYYYEDKFVLSTRR